VEHHGAAGHRGERGEGQADDPAPAAAEAAGEVNPGWAFTDDAWAEYHKLLFGVRMSVRYHEKREAFFSRANRVATGLSLLTSSAAAGSLLGKGTLAAALLASVAALASAFNMVTGAAEAAKRHAELKRRFVDLQAGMIAVAAPTADDLRKWTVARLDIERDEPPVLTTLTRICHNEQVRVQGFGDLVIVGRGWRWLADVLSGPEDARGYVEYTEPGQPPPA
jgi:hypothetical protein